MSPNHSAAQRRALDHGVKVVIAHWDTILIQIKAQMEQLSGILTSRIRYMCYDLFLFM